MGVNRFMMVRKVFKEFDGDVMSLSAVRRVIIMYLSSEPRRVGEYIDMMTMGGLISEIKPNEWKVKIE